MTHGDDDGLRLPPAIAPRQIVIVPMLRDKPEDEELLDYCASLEKELKAAGIRVLVDAKPVKSAEKRWNWVRRGAPVIVEIGGRDAAGGNVTFMRRDALRDGDKVVSHTRPRAEFVAGAPALLDDIQARLFAEAKARLDGNIVSDIKTFDELAEYFGAAAADDEGGAFKGWAYVAWSKPEGAKLEAIAERLKALKLTIRNAPLDQEAGRGRLPVHGGSGTGIRADRARLLGEQAGGCAASRQCSAALATQSGPIAAVALPRAGHLAGDDSGGCVAYRGGDEPAQSRPDARLGKWALNTGDWRHGERSFGSNGQAARQDGARYAAVLRLRVDAGLALPARPPRGRLHLRHRRLLVHRHHARRRHADHRHGGDERLPQRAVRQDPRPQRPRHRQQDRRPVRRLRRRRPSASPACRASRRRCR